MEPDLVSTFVHLIRATLSTWLFTIAGVILVVSHPRWRGSWVLLLGAILLSALAGVRLIGLLPREIDARILLAFDVADAVGYLMAGLGALLVSIRARDNSP